MSSKGLFNVRMKRATLTICALRSRVPHFMSSGYFAIASRHTGVRRRARSGPRKSTLVSSGLPYQFGPRKSLVSSRVSSPSKSDCSTSSTTTSSSTTPAPLQYYDGTMLIVL